MTDAEDFKSLRRLALASLGRNVLHFQRLEAQLKLLVLFCDFQSPLDQVAANHKKQAEKIRMKTMGTLVSELHERLYGQPPDPQTTQDITEASLAIGFRVDADPDYLDQQKQKLNALVIERNELVHQGLAAFDPSSAESCRHWITRLDEQNERILAQLKAVQHLVETCKQAFQELLTAMNSEAWRRGFESRPKRS